MGKKSLSRVMVNVAVITCLSVDPLIGTFFDPFAAIVLLETGRYFDGVWSKLRTNDRVTSFSSTFLKRLCKYAFSSYLRRASGIGTLPVVVNLYTKKRIRRNRFSL